MKARERKLLEQLVAYGIPRDFALSAVDWRSVRNRPKTTADEIVLDLVRSRKLVPTVSAIPIPGVGDAADVVLNLLLELFRLFVPPPPPRPQTFTAVEKELEWCRKVPLCEVGAGDYATIKVSNNGIGGPDDEGEVEVSADGAAEAPAIDLIKGNGSTTLVGPKKLWVHLKGGTAEDPAEDACDVEVEIQRFG